MIEYIKFWLAQGAVSLGITAAALLVLFLAALWSVRGYKGYKEPKK